MKDICKIFFIFFVLQLNAFPQSYVIEEVITGLYRPVAFCFLPNGNIILTQQGGLIKIYDQNNQQISTFWNFTDSCLSVQELGTIGIAIDPDYTLNHKVYIYYTHKIPPVLPGDYNHRIYSFVENSNSGTLPKKYLTIFRMVQLVRHTQQAIFISGKTRSCIFHLVILVVLRILEVRVERSLE